MFNKKDPLLTDNLAQNDLLVTDSTKYWKFEYDDTHVVFLHTVLNIAVELVRKGSGWFHCRDGNQRVVRMVFVCLFSLVENKTVYDLPRGKGRSSQSSSL